MKKLFSLRNFLPRCTAGLFPVLAAFVVVQFLGPEAIVFAQEESVLKDMAEFASVFINLFTFLSLLLLNFGGVLVGSEMVTGDVPMNAIQPMWVFIRNLTNIGFVVVLVFLAFSNLFASMTGEAGGGAWTIKEKLPKIIIALVAINFSLLGFKVAVDAIHVGTVAIFGIADTALEENDFMEIGDVLKKHYWVEKKKPSPPPSKKVELGPRKAGDSCQEEYDEKILNLPDGPEKPKGTILTAEIKDDTENWLVCKSFRETLNDVVCEDWRGHQDEGDKGEEAAGDDSDCFFMINEGYSTSLEPSTKSSQNLFMAFGSIFMHLERLPALAANLRSLGSVVDATIFSGILSLAYVVALAAVFIALLARIVVLWIAMVFSPLLIGASILGIGGGEGGGKISSMVVTHLIMPIKVAAAFAVSFVMMLAMVEFTGGVGGENLFWFGPALSQMGQGEFAILWQIATIVIFWKVAFWAVEGTAADFIVQGIRTGAERVGGFVARAATIDRQIFSIGEKGKVAFTTMLKMPAAIEADHAKKMTEDYQQLAGHMGWMDDKTKAASEALSKFRMNINELGGLSLAAQAEKVGGVITTMGTDKIGSGEWKVVMRKFAKKIDKEKEAEALIEISAGATETQVKNALIKIYPEAQKAIMNMTFPSGGKAAPTTPDGGGAKFEIKTSGEGAKITSKEGHIKNYAPVSLDDFINDLADMNIKLGGSDVNNVAKAFNMVGKEDEVKKKLKNKGVLT